MFGLQQPQLLAAIATFAAMANNPSPAVSMASSAAGLPGVFPSGGMADQAQALQTFAQLQSLFMPNPAAAAQMMSMQQVDSFLNLSFMISFYLLAKMFSKENIFEHLNNVHLFFSCKLWLNCIKGPHYHPL